MFTIHFEQYKNSRYWCDWFYWFTSCTKTKYNHQVATLNARTVSNSNTEWHQAVDDCDVLIHLAGRAHVSSNNSSTESDIYKIINTELTCVLAERLAKQSSKHIIFVSTAVVFGAVSNPNQPFRTSDIPNPDGPYAESKIEAENTIIKICEKTSLTYTIIRPPLVYGPNVRANSVFCQVEEAPRR